MEHGTQSKDKAKEAWYAKDLLIEILQEQMKIVSGNHYIKFKNHSNHLISYISLIW